MVSCPLSSTCCNLPKRRNQPRSARATGQCDRNSSCQLTRARHRHIQEQMANPDLPTGHTQPTRSLSPAHSITGPKAKSSTESTAVSRRRSSSKAQQTRSTTRCAFIYFSGFLYYDALHDSSTSTVPYSPYLQIGIEVSDPHCKHYISAFLAASAARGPRDLHVAIFIQIVTYWQIQVSGSLLACSSHCAERVPSRANLEEESGCSLVRPLGQGHQTAKSA